MSNNIRLTRYDPNRVVWLRRRPAVPRWANKWTAGALLLAVAAVVAGELARHGRG